MTEGAESDRHGGPAGEQQQRRKQELVSWLTRRWSEPHNCPICASSDWQLDDGGDWPAAGGAPTSYPLFPVTCQVCGYVFFLNGHVAGGPGHPSST